MKTLFPMWSLALICLLIEPRISNSTTWYLDPTGPVTIEEAIASSADGDTILLAKGTYSGAGYRNLRVWGKAIVIMSVEGPDSTIIDCESVARGFLFVDGEGRETVLSGVKVTNGLGNRSGGALYIDVSSPTVTGNIFKRNKTRCDNPSEMECAGGAGGAIYVRLGAPLIACNRFVENFSRGYPGGAIYCYGGEAEIVSNYFEGNNANECCSMWNETLRGGAIHAYSGRPLLSNNVFYRNFGRDGGQAISFTKGINAVHHCTVVDNIGWSDEVPVFVDNGTALIENSIFAHNSHHGAGTVIQCDGAATVTLHCNDFFTNGPSPFCVTDSSANIFLDPLLADYENGDFELLPGSPCLPAGNACGMRMGAGVPRLYYGTSPAQVDTAVADPGTVVCVTFNLIPPVEGAGVTFDVSGANSASGSGVTDSLGAVEFCYEVTTLGTDTITVSATTCFIGALHATSARLVRTFLPSVPVVLQSFDSRWAGDHVEVTWLVLDAGEDLDCDVYRREIASAPYLRVRDPDVTRGENGFIFRDASVKRGVAYDYRIVVAEHGETVASFETTVSVPAPALALRQNRPNPFRSSTEIGFDIHGTTGVVLSVYDVSGRRVRTIVSRRLEAGEYTEVWDGRDENGNAVASGIYFYRLETGTRALNRKAVLLR